jgi:hypothetical protein
LQFIAEIKTSSILIVDAIVKGNVVAENLKVLAQARVTLLRLEAPQISWSLSPTIEPQCTPGLSVEKRLATQRKFDPTSAFQRGFYPYR